MPAEVTKSQVGRLGAYRIVLIPPSGNEHWRLGLAASAASPIYDGRSHQAKAAKE